MLFFSIDRDMSFLGWASLPVEMHGHPWRPARWCSGAMDPAGVGAHGSSRWCRSTFPCGGQTTTTAFSFRAVARKEVHDGIASPRRGGGGCTQRSPVAPPAPHQDPIAWVVRPASTSSPCSSTAGETPPRTKIPAAAWDPRLHDPRSTGVVLRATGWQRRPSTPARVMGPPTKSMLPVDVRRW
jgi:hypothetical protein